MTKISQLVDGTIAREDLDKEIEYLISEIYELDKEFDSLIDKYQGEIYIRDITKTLIYLAQYLDHKVKKVRLYNAQNNTLKISRQAEYQVIDNIDKLFENDEKLHIFVSPFQRKKKSQQLHLNQEKDTNILKATYGLPRPLQLVNETMEYLIENSKMKEITTTFFLHFMGNPDFAYAKIIDGYELIRKTEARHKENINSLTNQKKDRSDVLQTLIKVRKDYEEVEMISSNYSKRWLNYRIKCRYYISD